jgi:hypothetical protein
VLSQDKNPVHRLSIEGLMEPIQEITSSVATTSLVGFHHLLNQELRFAFSVSENHLHVDIHRTTHWHLYTPQIDRWLCCTFVAVILVRLEFETSLDPNVSGKQKVCNEIQRELLNRNLDGPSNTTHPGREVLGAKIIRTTGRSTKDK